MWFPAITTSRSRPISNQATFTVDRPIAAGTAEIDIQYRGINQDASLFLARLLTNRDPQSLAWELLRARWDDLQKKTGQVFGSPLLIAALGSFCDARTATEVQEFFASHKVPEAERTLQQAIERISNCARLATAQAPRLAEWLSARGAGK